MVLWEMKKSTLTSFMPLLWPAVHLSALRKVSYSSLATAMILENVHSPCAEEKMGNEPLASNAYGTSRSLVVT